MLIKELNARYVLRGFGGLCTQCVDTVADSDHHLLISENLPMTENQSVQKWWRHHLEEIGTPPKRSNPVFSIFRPVLYQILTFRICACFAELRQNPSSSPKMVCRFQISKPQGSTLAVYRSRVRSVWFWGVRYRTPVRGYRDLDSSYRDLLARTLISWGIYRFAQRSWFGLVRFRYHLNKSQIELL